MIKQSNPNKGLVSVTCEECTKSFDLSGIRNAPEDEELYNSLFDSGINTDIMLVDKYFINDNYLIPANLILQNPNIYAFIVHC